MAEPKRIALVGHCGPDAHFLRSAISRFVPEAEVVLARDAAALETEIRSADLLLINRTMDGDYIEERGVELIRRVAATKSGQRRPALMLVSNFPESQSEAEQAGALPGFGKREAHSDSTRAKVRGALGLD